MSLSFCPSSIQNLDDKPEIVIKDKDQDFTIGKSFYYKFSSDENFSAAKTIDGRLFLAVLAVECKVNYDKTMFQECAGTAARLKQGCPISKYYALVEYLDMQPEDVRLTSIDNVFLLRKTKRLPYDKRNDYEEVRRQHAENPISFDVMKNFVKELHVDGLPDPQYVFKAGKPKSTGYLKGVEIMKLRRSQVLFIGDQLLTDVWGANNAGIPCILVQPVAPEKKLQIKLKRILEKPVLWRYRKKHPLKEH